MPLTKEDVDALLEGISRLAIVGVAKNLADAGEIIISTGDEESELIY